MKMAVLQLNQGPKLYGVNSILHTPEVISLVEEKGWTHEQKSLNAGTGDPIQNQMHDGPVLRSKYHQWKQLTIIYEVHNITWQKMTA